MLPFAGNLLDLLLTLVCEFKGLCLGHLLGLLISEAMAKPKQVTTRLPDMVLRLNIHNTTATFIAYKYQPGMHISGNSNKGQSQGSLEYNSTAIADEDYDAKGAMYFAVAVILLYGVSIALMIGSTLRKQEFEYEVKGFLRSYARIDQQKRKREKQRVRNTLIKRNLLSVMPECTLAAAPSVYLSGSNSSSKESMVSVYHGSMTDNLEAIKEEDDSSDGSKPGQNVLPTEANKCSLNVEEV